VLYSNRDLCYMLASPLQTLSTSYLYPMTKSGSGISMATKSYLYVVVHMLLSPQIALSSFHVVKELPQFKTLIPE